MRLTASFHTLGCRLNQAETALMSNRFRAQGYEIVDTAAASDVCVINSCTVTEGADSKCRQLVRQVLRRNPGTFVAVVGCYAQVAAEALKKIDGIDLIVGTRDKLQVLDFIEDPIKRPEPQVVRGRLSREPFTIATPGLSAPSTRANLKIQDGCDFMCSFCIIPFARGRARSRAFGDIQREALQLIEAGHRELVLTGVNLGTYQFEEKKFLDVVKMLLAIRGLERLRVSSIEPTTIPEELIELMADSTVLCPHLHIPVQSGDDRVLAAMKRLYTRRDFEEFISFVNKHVPQAMIATDLMVGFPGETAAAFQASCDLLMNSPLAYAHVFTYSERGGTAATMLGGRISAREKKARSGHLHALSERKKSEFYGRFLGKTLRVLIEERNEDGSWPGFSDNYVKVAVLENGLSANQLVQAYIYAMGPDFVAGQVDRNALPAPEVAWFKPTREWRKNPMSIQPKRKMTAQEYLAQERQAEYKSEYYQGEIIAMAGASQGHNLIMANVIRALGNQLVDRNCELYPIDMRVKINVLGKYTYPDVVVACGRSEFEDERKDTLLNPVLIVEVLSHSTEAYDRGRKFEHYQYIKSLAEYILITPDAHRVEQFVRQTDWTWTYHEFHHENDALDLQAIGCRLTLGDIYAKVFAPPAPPA